ncbi:transglycosylase SLT domain-containing protein [Thorsellia kenyensis]|uniref:Transglycosylase SLT domain-containing protein n=1 Tax=Thorsellia kenyensis TaxID=1549888 RepID=A0ABV6CFI6_9GAMM
MKKTLQTLLFTTVFATFLLTGCQSQSNAKTIVAPTTTDNPDLDWIDKTFKKQDIWTFVASEMTLPNEKNDRVQKEIAFYEGKTRYFKDVSKRAEPYMYWISKEIKDRNLPMELVLIPVIESGFQTEVVSSQNAAGLWQFVPSTGKNFGLTQNQRYDGRHDVVASTKAALDLLEKLNKMFDGDWLLTLAAYNSGEGRVMKAIAANKKKGQPTDYWSLSSLPSGTQQYIPRILALQTIFKNPEAYGVSLTKADKSHALIPVKIDQPIELSAAADKLGITEGRLQTLNAGYKKGVTRENGEHYVLLPRALEKRFISSIESGEIARASFTNSEKSTALVSNEKKSTNKKSATAKKASSSPETKIVYTIKKGDSLGLIAQKHGVKLKDLRSWNAIKDDKKLQLGAKVTIYVKNSS